MKNRNNIPILLSLVIVLGFGTLTGCKLPQDSTRSTEITMPGQFFQPPDSGDVSRLDWRDYFNDSNLRSLIDTALKNNRELNIVLQEIEVSRNEIRAKKGEYLPSLSVGATGGLEKEARYTRLGALDEQIEIIPGKEFPKPLQDYSVGVFASWELDVWSKLRNAKKAAVKRYLATVEVKNFLVTNLIAEIANSYYELMAMDNMLEIVDRNVEIQSNALQIVRQLKDAARVTQLAVNRFEAQLLNTTNLRFEIQQQRIETENRIRFLTGGFPGPVPRNSRLFHQVSLDSFSVGVPSLLLLNRPDIRKTEQELSAAKLDVKVARANFYPSIRISAGAGFQAFNPAYLVNPGSMLYNLAGDLMAPLVNRNAIKANYYGASARQVQAMFQYEQTILNAYIEVVNQLSRISNYTASYETKTGEVAILMQSVVVSNNLFRSARADYLEVLLTQREALESKMELIEIKLKQLTAKVNLYRVLGGGWTQAAS